MIIIAGLNGRDKLIPMREDARKDPYSVIDFLRNSPVQSDADMR